MQRTTIQNALISVSDKLGVADFARGLAGAGVEIYSTGGTRRFLENEGLEIRDIAAYTGFPEMLDGRLKTLHPKVFGGILFRRDVEDHVSAVQEHGIAPLDLVVVNLYPFERTVAREGVTIEEAIEQIDIGGPSLVRAAAKNHAHVAIATNPEQYSEILSEIEQEGGLSPELRRRLAAEAFVATASYDRAIACYFTRATADSDFPPSLNICLHRKAELRYGENPHQRAALYQVSDERGPSLVLARQLNGKELSFNNLLDLDSALAIARSMPDAAVAVVKHHNPCGAASDLSLPNAAKKALEGDPLSAFGSVLGVNRVIDADTADVLTAPGLFIEAIAAPAFEPKALEILTTRPKWKKNVRLMQIGDLSEPPAGRQYRFLEGGMLVQDADVQPDSEDEWRVVTEQAPSDEQLEDLRFAWAIMRHVKSNAIVLAKQRALVGVGAGQMSRVDSVDIAVSKAGERAAGSVLASDAFFPFPDGVRKAAAAGVAAVIQPGGSRGDNDVIAACNEHGLPMIFTGRRHFKH